MQPAVMPSPMIHSRLCPPTDPLDFPSASGGRIETFPEVANRTRTFAAAMTASSSTGFALIHARADGKNARQSRITCTQTVLESRKLFGRLTGVPGGVVSDMHAACH